MFTSTFELITLAASNSHILFCFCNLIIAILLIGTKPIFSFDRQATIPPPDGEGSHNMVDDDIKSIDGESITQNVMVDDDDHERADGDGVDDVDGKQDVTTSNKEHNQDKEEEDEEGGGEEEDDDHDRDELRRRVEEFIDKINKAWKAEKLGHIYSHSS